MNFNKKLFFLVTILKLIIINASGKSVSFYNQLRADTTLVAKRDGEIALKWKQSTLALKNIFMNSIKTSIPLMFNFARSLNISSPCKSSLIDMVKALVHQKIWAVKMLDSCGKGLDGIFTGSLTALGDYDQCISIKNTLHKFQGKYCLTDIGFPLPPRRSFSRTEDEIPELKDIMEPESIGAEFVKYAAYMYTSQIRIALCVPSTCSADEVEAITRKGLEKKKLPLNVHVPYCEVQEKVTYTIGEILIIILFAALTAIVITGTVFDVTLSSISEDFATSEKSTPLKYMLCFSAYTNFLKLLKKDNNPDTLTIFHGLRVITLCWIILCHTYLTVNFHAHDRLLPAKDIPKSFWFTAVMNGHVSVDTFFFMSSVLVSYVCMRVPGKLNVILIFFKRYWRLTPTMMLVIALIVISGRFGSGPLWRETYVDELSNKCKNYGWWNLLYINNLYPLTDVCLRWTWYLSTDTQLFIISLFVIILLKRNVTKGLLVLLLLLVVGVIWTAFIIIYYHIPPVYLQSFLHRDDNIIFTSKVHSPPQIHLPTASIGLLTGYVMAMKKIHISKRISRIGWTVTGIIMPSIIYGVYYWNQGNIPGDVVSALYASTQRIFWGLCLAFITISCTTKKKGIVYSILSWEAFIPLSRLTYVAYLIHYTFIYFYTASIRSTYTFSHKNMLFLYFSVLSLTFFVSCLLSLFIESPFMALEKVLTDRVTEKKILPVRFMNGIEKDFKRKKNEN